MSQLSLLSSASSWCCGCLIILQPPPHHRHHRDGAVATSLSSSCCGRVDMWLSLHCCHPVATTTSSSSCHASLSLSMYCCGIGHWHVIVIIIFVVAWTCHHHCHAVATSSWCCGSLFVVSSPSSPSLSSCPLLSSFVVSCPLSPSPSLLLLCCCGIGHGLCIVIVVLTQGRVVVVGLPSSLCPSLSSSLPSPLPPSPLLCHHHTFHVHLVVVGAGVATLSSSSLLHHVALSLPLLYRLCTGQARLVVIMLVGILSSSLQVWSS